MKLDVSERTLAAFLSTPQEQLSVPLYQRPYSWTTQEVDQLWEDLSTQLDGEHFMGSIVLNDETSLRPQIIDGQQRLATLMILLALVRDEYHALGSQFQGRPQMLLTADPWAEGEARFKLRLGEANHRVFRDFVLRDSGDVSRRVWAEKASLAKDELVDNTELFGTAARLRSLLSDYLKGLEDHEREKRLVALEEKLSKRLLFVIIRVGNVDDAFLLFETLNDRGLQLSAADLVKSHLLSRIENENGKEKVSEAAQEWSELVDLLRGADIGRFLRYYLLMYNPKVQTDRVFKLFKNRLEETTAESMLSHLKIMARYFGEFEQPALVSEAAIRDVLEDLQDLRSPTTYVALLPARHALKDQSSDFVRLARLTEALAYRWTTIVGKNAQQLESIFQEAGSLLVTQGAASLDMAEGKVSAVFPSKAEFIDSFRSKRMGVQYVARYTLRRIEEALSPDLEWTLKSPSKVHIEHIMPQHLSQPWQEALGESALEKHSESVGKWGNLTLLAEKLNKEARDSSFEAKKKIYLGPPGSSLAMTQLLQSETAWGPAEIDARQRWLAEVAEQVWSQAGSIDASSIKVPDYPFVDPEDAVNQIRHLIVDHETSRVEFKSTARTNLHTNQRDPEIEKSFGKTITAFANSHEGGTLLVGVADNGEIRGIEPDYRFVQGNRDGFAQWVTTYVKDLIDPVLASKIAPKFIPIDERTVCRIDISPFMHPVFLKDKGAQRFYVRLGNLTHELAGSDMLKYQSERWTTQG